MSDIEPRTVRFSVVGEGLTDIARNMMLSDRPDGAWRLIAQGLIGDGREAAAQGVLDGSMKLVDGDDGQLVLKEDKDSDGYLTQLRFIYAGRIRMDDIWWRPVAVISYFGPDSARWASRDDDPLSNRDEHAARVMRTWFDRRAAFFCGRRERAILVNRQYIVWETCGERPYWWAPNNTPADAFAEAMGAGRRLDERGEDFTTRDVLESMQNDDKISPQELRETRAEAEAAEAIARDAAHAALLEDIRDRVRKQAKGDTFVLVVPADPRTEGPFGSPREPTPERRLVIPRAPFWHWALGRTSLRHMAPPWEPVAPSGLKLSMDDPYHSDWMIGAGLSLQNDYGPNNPVSEAAREAMFALQERLGSFEVTVLVDNGPVLGKVGEEILVLPDLSVKHAPHVLDANPSALIAERGGAMAHLSVIGLERGLTILIVDDAMTRFQKGQQLCLEPAVGSVSEVETDE